MAKKKIAKKQSKKAKTIKKTRKPTRAKAAARKPVKRATKPKSKTKSRAAVRPAAKTVRPATRPAAGPPRRDPLRELARRIVDLTVAGDDESSFDLYSDAIESAEMGTPPSRGMQALREKFQMWRNMVRDATWSARNVAVGGNSIVIEWTGTVTFNATGKTIELNEIAVHEVENGKIVRERFYYNPAVLQSAMMPDESPEEASPSF